LADFVFHGPGVVIDALVRGKFVGGDLVKGAGVSTLCSITVDC
jgi:hypothetical protein